MNPQEDDIQKLKRKSTHGDYTVPREDGGPGYAERRTWRPVAKGSMKNADRKKIFHVDNEQRLILSRGMGAETSSKISDFLKKRGYKRDESIKRETYKPDMENTELRNLNEQAKDKGKINFDRWRVKTRKLRRTDFGNPLYKGKKGKGKRRRKKKRRTRKRRRTKKKRTRKRRRKKRRRTRKKRRKKRRRTRK